MKTTRPKHKHVHPQNQTETLADKTCCARRKAWFSLIEMVVGLVIVIVGIIAVLVIFPVGLNTQREAIGISFASDAAEQFLHFTANKIEADRDWLHAIPNQKPAGHHSDMVWSDASLIDNGGIRIRFASENAADCFDPGVHNTGIFYHQQMTENIVDYASILRVWKQIDDFANGAFEGQLHIEISWPAEKPYGARDKELFSLEISRGPEMFVTGSLAISDSPCLTAWSIIDDDGVKLSYTVLSAEDTVTREEGSIENIGGQVAVTDLAIAANGAIYFMAEENAALYRIPPQEIDKDASTPVHSALVGYTKLQGPDMIYSLEFVDGELHGISTTSKKIWLINTVTAEPTQLGSVAEGSFETEAFTVDANGSAYLVRLGGPVNELWKFACFPEDEVNYVMDLPGTKDITALTGHPNGRLYATNASQWFEISPDSRVVDEIANSTAGTMAFFNNSPREFSGCGEVVPDPIDPQTETGPCGSLAQVNIDPGDASGSLFCLEKPDGARITRDELLGGAAYSGPATSLFLKPHGNSDGSAITLDDAPYSVANGNTYIISNGTIDVTLYNAFPSHSDPAAVMEHWWICVDADGATVASGSANPCVIPEISNTPPVAQPDTYSIDAGTILVLAEPGVMANDTDANNDPLSAYLVDDVSHGTVCCIEDGAITYEPAVGFHGTDTFTYEVSDGTDRSSITTVTITVNQVNTPPAAVTETYEVVAGNTLTVPAAGILLNDTDPDNDALLAELVTTSANGDLILNSNGSFSFTPHPGFTGLASFVYRAGDGDAYSADTIVAINVSPGEPPVPDFTITADNVVPSDTCHAAVTVLGAAVSYGGQYDMPVTVNVLIGGDPVDDPYPFGNFGKAVAGNVNDDDNPRTYSIPDEIPAGTPISVSCRVWKKKRTSYSGSQESHWKTYTTISPQSSNMMVLRNGEQAPDLEGFLDQGNLVSFLQGYIDADNIVTLDENQAIFLFEYNSSQNSPAWDMQDTVIVLSLTSPQGSGIH